MGGLRHIEHKRSSICWSKRDAELHSAHSVSAPQSWLCRVEDFIGSRLQKPDKGRGRDAPAHRGRVGWSLSASDWHCMSGNGAKDLHKTVNASWQQRPHRTIHCQRGLMSHWNWYLHVGYLWRERAGATAVRQRGWLPAAGTVHVYRRPWRHVAVHTVDGCDSTRSARSTTDGPPDRALVRSAQRHRGRWRQDRPLRGHCVRPRCQYHLHQNNCQL